MVNAVPAMKPASPAIWATSMGTALVATRLTARLDGADALLSLRAKRGRSVWHCSMHNPMTTSSAVCCIQLRQRCRMPLGRFNRLQLPAVLPIPCSAAAAAYCRAIASTLASWRMPWQRGEPLPACWPAG